MRLVQQHGWKKPVSLSIHRELCSCASIRILDVAAHGIGSRSRYYRLHFYISYYHHMELVSCILSAKGYA